MKKIILFFAIVFAYQFIHAQSFTGTGGSIPGIGTTPTCFSTTVSGVGTINGAKGLAQICLRITHPNVGDLEVLLKAPDGTYVPLSMQNGPGGANFTNTCFTPTATTAIKFGTAPFTGNFLPEGHLGAVNNGQNADGAWSICITDIRNSGSSGVLNSFTLTFNNTPAPVPPALPACANTLPLNTTCANATPICDFSGLCGSTSGNTALTWAQLTTAACFGIENNSFVKFTASATTASFSIWVNSSTGGVAQGGVQMLFFSGTCNGAVTSYGCYRHILPSVTPGIPLVSVITAQGLTIGNTYYIMIDGYNGANTSFTIEANSGVNFLGVNPAAPTICEGQNVNLTASGGNGVYAWSPATGLSATSGTTVNAAPTVTQTYTVSSTTPNGCAITKDVTVTVSPATPPPVTNFTYDKISACANESNPVLQPGAGFTPGGTFTVSPPGLSINASTGAIDVASSTAGDYVITYTVAANGCNAAVSSTFAFSIYTNTTPITGISYSPGTVCSNAANPTLTKDVAFTPGGTYTALPAGLSIDPSTGAIDVAASTPGNYTITYAVVASGCTLAGSSNTTFTINASTAPVTGFSYTPNAICLNGSNPTLNTVAGFTTGGTYSASPAGLSINAGTGAINVATSSAGNYTVTYTIAATGCAAAGSNTAAIALSSVITPVTGFSYSATSACKEGGNPTIYYNAGFTTGGNFSASPTGLSINTATGDIDVIGSDPGIYTITYSVAASGCLQAGSGQATFTVNASTTPVTGFSYTPNAICVNGTNPTLNAVAGFTTGGTYSASPAGLNIDPATGAVNVAASTPGFYTITYSVAATGCAAAGSSSTTVTINSNITPTTGFTYSSLSACKNGSNPTVVTIAGFTTGGTFTATPAGLSLNAGTGNIDVAASAAGNYTITYTIISSGCVLGGSSQAGFSVYTNTNPITGFRYQPDNVCANATNPLLDKDLAFTAGGTYTSSPAGLSIDANTGAIAVLASTPGTYSITYTVGASGCTLAGSGTTTFTINPTTTPVTGFSYLPNTACANAGNPALNTVGGFTTGGTYSASPAGLSIDVNTGAINVAASTAGNYTITYTVTSTGCAAAGSGTTAFTVTANTTPVTGFSYTPNTICVNGSNPVLNTNTGFATGGTFTSSPAGLNINATTGAVNIAASSAGTYTITYSVPASGCALAASSTTTVTINTPATPVTDFNYTPNAVCINGSNPTLNTTTGFTTGGTYSAVPGGLNIDAATGAINVAASNSGTYTITYSVAAAGCSLAGSSTSTVTINSIITPVTNFNYSLNTVCANGAAPAINTGAGFTTGGTFSATPSGLNIDAATGAINIAASTAGNYIIKYSVAASGCTVAGFSTFDLAIIANITPVTGFSYSPGNVCANGNNPAVNTNAGFTTGGIFAAAPAGLNINAATGAINIAASSAGVYTITYNIAASGCQLAGSSSADFTITAIPAPAITAFSYSSPVCKNDASPSPVTATGFATGGIFSSTNGLPINANTGVVNLSASTTGTYTITYTIAATLCSPVQTGTATITINNSPIPPAVANGRSCGPGVVTLTATGTTGIVNWYDDAGLTNLVNTGTSYAPLLTATTVYRVTETVGICTSNPAIVTATIGTIPAAPSLGNDTAICEGDRITLNAGAYSGYTWQDGSGNSTFIVTQPGIYSVQVNNGDGCTSSSSINITPENDCSDIYFPSAFAPDGKNNLFGPVSLSGSVTGITKYSLTIYNRYGQIVFLSTDPLQKWDGTYKGRKMGVGNFVWYSSYLYRGRAFKKQKGSLLLIR